MSDREEFETSPRFKGMDFTRSVTHPEYYESPYANGAWDGWKASRESIVLPARCPEKTVGPNPFRSNYAVGWDDCLAEVSEAIKV